MEARTCKYCNKTFENIGGRVFSNHVRWCEYRNCLSEKQKQWANNQIAIGTKAYLDQKLGEVKSFVVSCCKCGVNFEVQEREFQHPKKSKYHCSVSCRNSRTQTAESRKKVGDTLRAKYKAGEIPSPTGGRGFTKSKRGSISSTSDQPRQRIPVKEPTEKICLNCESLFKSRTDAKFCTRECRNQYDRKHLSDFAIYKAECRFRFHIKDFPDEFDFDLIRDFGWYKAANHGNNTGGVSRDHMVSVRWGFDNGVLPQLLRHPANCQLLRHSDNISKHKKCSLAVEELLTRIEDWDKKYGFRSY